MKSLGNTPVDVLKRYQKLLFLLTIIVLLVAVIIISLTLPMYFFHAKPQPSGITPSPTPYQNLVIKKASPAGDEVIYSRNLETEHHIILWGHYLFFDAFQPGQEIDTVYRYNLTTGKKDAVYTVDSNKTHQRSVTNMQLFENSLFFTTSGYLAGSDIFWLATPEASIQKLNYSEKYGLGKIIYDQIHNRYWLTGGEGDSCWGTENFALLDMKSKRVTPVITTSEGCSSGESFVALDNQDRMLVSYHQTKEGALSPNEQVFLSLVAIPIASPSHKYTLLDKVSMPKQTYAIKYSSEGGQLALAGETGLYIYHLDSGQLNKILEFTEDMKKNLIEYGLSHWIQNTICFSGFLSSNGEKYNYEINLQKKTIKEGNSYCNTNQEHEIRSIFEEDMYSEQEFYKERDNLISKLKSTLPSLYQITTQSSR